MSAFLHSLSYPHTYYYPIDFGSFFFAFQVLAFSNLKKHQNPPNLHQTYANRLISSSYFSQSCLISFSSLKLPGHSLPVPALIFLFSISDTWHSKETISREACLISFQAELRTNVSSSSSLSD